MSFMDSVRPAERIEGNTLAKMARGEINSRSTNATHGTGALNAQAVGGDDPTSQSLSFADFIDVINPLQHIPIISTLYQRLTGDEISAPAKVAGDALFMGPLGAAAAIINLALKEQTGEDLGGHVANLFFDEEDAPEFDTAVADNQAQQQIQAQSLAALAQTQAQPQVQPQLQKQAANTAHNTTETPDTLLDPDAPFSFPGVNGEMPQETTAAQNNLQTVKQSSDTDFSAQSFANPIASFNSSQQPVNLESLPADILAALYSGTPLNSDTTPFANSTDSQAPRWNLWQEEESAAMPSPAALAPQALFPRAMNAYETSGHLKTQAQQPFVNMVQ
ncbi:MAG: hypothetical protein HON65_06660 [Rhodospirillales bacterium]|jgi:hypothetical protein|nr:hypothetical protein [Rhodospirillales bacterium]